MLRLILLRHSKATAHVASGDAERALNRRGQKDARHIGEYLRAVKLFPDLALTSPARRARETLEIALGALAGEISSVEKKEFYLAEPETLLAVVKDTPKDVGTLLLVGHNPGIADFANALAGTGELRARAAMGMSFPTTALAIIDFDLKQWADADFGRGRLERFVTPATLEDEEEE